ncbi:guanylate kinase [Candidatus Fermentibacterales bacterium]|nr:guanylate kinase [Candidatus Fermentibacterales bacterium]
MSEAEGYGILLVISGPLAAGKTTLARRLVEEVPGCVFSVSCTTREPRGSESDGLDYRFTTPEEFESLVLAGHFLEWAEVHGSRYGTPAGPVDAHLAAGRSVVLDIDVQGAMQVLRARPSAVLAFVSPPSLEVLAGRLRKRMTDSAGEVERRLGEAVRESRWAGAFDYFLCNAEPDPAFEELRSIVEVERKRLERSPYPDCVRAYEAEWFHGLGWWRGRSVVVTAGPTREPIDEVRFVSNRSSGRMGFDLARAFRDAGARVTLVSGPSSCPEPCAVEMVRVTSSKQMQAAVLERADGCDLVAMAAAVCDMSPDRMASGKLRRHALPLAITFQPTADILASLAGSGCPVLAFALEMGEEGSRERAMEKLREKGALAIFLNRGDLPHRGMESEMNGGVLLFADGSSLDIPLGSKRYVAERLAAGMGSWLASRVRGTRGGPG